MSYSPSTSRKKVAVVTGSGKNRIGGHIACEAAERGYDVALHYNTSREAAEETVGKLLAKDVEARAFQANLEEDWQTLKMCSKVIDHFGRIDLLVTCAAIWEPSAFEKITGEEMRRHFAIDTIGTVLCCRALGEVMVAQQEGGSIVTMGDWAVEKPYLNYLAYFASKGSIPILTKLMANELAKKNPLVRVNSISPGPAMIPESVDLQEQKRIVDHNLVGKLGDPTSIVDAVFFLTENDFISGVTLPVDGGASLHAINEIVLERLYFL